MYVIPLADACRRMAGYEKKAVLEHVVQEMTKRKEEFAIALAIEAGKPIK